MPESFVAIEVLRPGSTREVTGPHRYEWLFVLAAAVLYGLASLLGGALWLPAAHAPAFSVSSGVYLAALLLFPQRSWWKLFLAFLLANRAAAALNHIPWGGWVALVLQSLSAFGVAWGLRWRGGFPYRFESRYAVFTFLGWSALGCGLVQGLGGALAMHQLLGLPMGASWLHWFLGNYVGVLLTTPCLVSLVMQGQVKAPEWTWQRIVEAAVLFITLTAAAFTVFYGKLAVLSLPTLLLMWSIWAVLRFGSAGAAFSLFLVAVVAIVATRDGLGPFVRTDRTTDESVLRLLAYIGLWAGFFEIVAAILHERAHALAALAALNRQLEGRVAERTESLTMASSALRESESRLALAVKAGRSGTFDWDAATNLNHWSDDLLALYGLKREEFKQSYEDWLEALLPEDREAGDAAVQNALRTGHFATQFRIRRRDTGEVRWMEGRGTVIFDAEGKPHRLLGLNVDVTDQRRAERAIMQTAARQGALLDLTRTILAKPANPEALGRTIFSKLASVLDADIGFNFRFRPQEGDLTLVACFGVDEEHLPTVQRLDLGHAFCGTVAATGQSLMADSACILTNPKGALVRSMGVRAYACNPLLSSDGRLLGTLSFGSRRRDRFEPDEIDFLQTLCHFVAMAWERSSAEAAMAESKDAAEQANRAKDDFLAALSHELRTPLNPVLLLSSELEHRTELPAEMLQDLATIRRNVELEARLIDDLLDLTRITRGKVSLDLRPISVHRAVRDALEILQGDLEAKELRLHVKLEAEVDSVQGDPVRLQQVFWNILRNAIKFTPSKGTVIARTFITKEQRLALEVEDTGTGIVAEHLERIFETFHQADGGHRFGGLGLGLAIARSLVEMHGGKISAQSQGKGQGALFRVELPLIETLATEEAEKTKTPSRISAQPLVGLRILLVEDHEPTRSALTRLLERRRHEVKVAENLSTARELAAAESFDLLISDLGLPDGDGTDLMRQLASAGGPPGIAISGYGMDEDLDRSSHAGFFAHLVKPVDMGILDRTMAALADSGRMARRN